jgi:hypothetical protein
MFGSFERLKIGFRMEGAIAGTRIQFMGESAIKALEIFGRDPAVRGLMVFSGMLIPAQYSDTIAPHKDI